jgi:hypothetical protein
MCDIRRLEFLAAKQSLRFTAAKRMVAASFWLQAADGR